MANPVLIVDDKDSDRATLAVLVRNAGFAAYVVKDGREALDRIPALKPGLILLDMLMPAFDGWDFLEHRRRIPEAASIPVIIVTGLEVASELWAKGMGAIGLLRKPVNPDRLVAKVREVLGAPTEKGIRDQGTSSLIPDP